MEKNPTIVRQSMGCGYEPAPPAGVPVVPWSFGWSKAAKVCAGYTCKLPEVIEATRAKLHWSKGQIHVHTQGEQATEGLALSIEQLEIEYSRVQDWATTPEAKGGGRAA